MYGIYDAGELSIVEFGTCEVLGSCKMRHISPHTISISLNKSEPRGKGCIMAYLEGRKQIHVTDLVTGASVVSINHDAKIDWLVISRNSCPYTPDLMRCYNLLISNMQTCSIRLACIEHSSHVQHRNSCLCRCRN